jgi:RHS repeat-associated protein
LGGKVGVGAGAYCFAFNGKEIDDDQEWGPGQTNYDYGFRIYNPGIARWLSIDPLTQQYISFSPYNYVLGNPLVFIDPDGRSVDDVIVRGRDAEGAVAELQKVVGDELTLSLDTETGKVTYTIGEEGAKLSKESRKLKEALDDGSIDVIISTRSSYLTSSGARFNGGAFLGNEVSEDSDGNVTVEAYQEVNVSVLSLISSTNDKPGADLLHEVTEAYEGALISKKAGESSGDASTQGSVYPKAHRRATNQSGLIYSDFLGGNLQPMSKDASGNYPGPTRSIVTYAIDKNGNKVVAQEIDIVKIYLRNAMSKSQQ